MGVGASGGGGGGGRGASLLGAFEVTVIAIIAWNLYAVRKLAPEVHFVFNLHFDIDQSINLPKSQKLNAWQQLCGAHSTSQTQNKGVSQLPIRAGDGFSG